MGFGYFPSCTSISILCHSKPLHRWRRISLRICVQKATLYSEAPNDHNGSPLMDDAFSRFEHQGWQRVAGQYDTVWSSSTQQFIPPLLDAAEVGVGMTVLDVG